MWEVPDDRSARPLDPGCMRALVIYESMYGNTHAVADAIAAGLVADSEGPLEDGELDRAREWAAGLASALAPSAS